MTGIFRKKEPRVVRQYTTTLKTSGPHVDRLEEAWVTEYDDDHTIVAAVREIPHDEGKDKPYFTIPVIGWGGTWSDGTED
jgi:hypothetical protein